MIKRTFIVQVYCMYTGHSTTLNYSHVKNIYNYFLEVFRLLCAVVLLETKLFDYLQFFLLLLFRIAKNLLKRERGLLHCKLEKISIRKVKTERESGLFIVDLRR